MPRSLTGLAVCDVKPEPGPSETTSETPSQLQPSTLLRTMRKA